LSAASGSAVAVLRGWYFIREKTREWRGSRSLGARKRRRDGREVIQLKEGIKWVIKTSAGGLSVIRQRGKGPREGEGGSTRLLSRIPIGRLWRW